ncbi:MAG: adenylate/guanylate cyclase domain-containing protein [Pseudomonadota bacterium]
MTPLPRLLKRAFLSDHLAEACRTLGEGWAAAVVAEGKTLAAAGAEMLTPDSEDCLTQPLPVGGETAGHLLLRGPSGDMESLRPAAALLAQGIAALAEAAEARRAVTGEALEAYRELSLLYRATVTLNQSLDQGEVARALLAEVRKEGDDSHWGAVLVGDGQGFSLLDSFGAPAQEVLEAVLKSQLFREIVQSEKGEVMNELAADGRWDAETPTLARLLIMPLIAHERCTGALVLGSGERAQEFTAGDLKQAYALATIAATVLYNARLYEEVVEARNFNESILENLSNGVITLNLLLGVTKTNAAARRILRLEQQPLVGSPISNLLGSENAWLLQPLSNGRIAEDGVHWADRDIVLKGGARVTVNLSVVPLRNVEQQQIGYMMVLEDITREKRIKGTMARFMSERVVEKLMDADESVLGGTAQDVTILFSDIRNFTGLSELMSAPQMVETLNDYFTDMVDVVFEHGGTLDKFIGDAIMAVFGAPFVTPEDPDKAANAAIEMMARLEHFNGKQTRRDAPSLDMGIGINSGTVVAGTIGSPRRMDYTVIGDQVNLASRIEAANKFYGTKILVSEHTAKKFSRDYRIREVDSIKVAGRQAPVAVFEVLDYHTETSFPAMEEVIQAYREGLRHYRRRAWKEGASFFAEALQANPNDRPTQIFLHRCWTYAAQPPDESWSGVTELRASPDA